MAVVATWFLVGVFAACGAALLARALSRPAERAAWGPMGAGLLLYAIGSVVYNLDSGAGFPSPADALWLALCPLCLTGMVGLVRARNVHVNTSLWLDGLIGGTVVAAVAAVFLLHPVVAMGEEWVTAVHLAYPLGDLLLMGFAVVLWGAGGWRLDAWFWLAAAFALIGMSDSVYVAAQSGEGWNPGTTVDLGYAAGAVVLAASAWRSSIVREPGLADRPGRAADHLHRRRVRPRGLRGVHRPRPVRGGADPAHPAGRRRPARPHAVVAVAAARRPRGARRLRPADRARQLPRVPGAAAPRGRRRRGDRHAGQRRRARPRPLQGAQRHVRSRRGRPCAPDHGRDAVADGGGGGLRRARRRGGVRDRAARHRRGRRRAGGRALPRRARLAGGRRPAAGVLGRRRLPPGARHRRRPAPARRRRRPLLGQAQRPRPRARVRPRARRRAVAGRAAARGRGAARPRRRDRCPPSSP